MSGNKLILINDTTDTQNNTDLGIKIVRTLSLTPAAAAASITLYDDVAATAANMKLIVKAPANGITASIALHGGVFGKGCFAVLTGAGAIAMIEQGL